MSTHGGARKGWMEASGGRSGRPPTIQCFCIMSGAPAPSALEPRPWTPAPTTARSATPCRLQRPAAVQVGVLMGSSSDWETMRHAAEILAEFGVAHECRVVSAHRMPDDMFAYAEAAAGRGLRGHHRRRRRRGPPAGHAGGQDHRAGAGRAGASRRHLSGVDSLHSIVQMPKGIPVATFAIGAAGRGQCGAVRGGHAGHRRPGAARPARCVPRAPDRGRAWP
jgi:5-(carboxyamino)imidazole ribonucleotide mutase